MKTQRTLESEPGPYPDSSSTFHLWVVTAKWSSGGSRVSPSSLPGQLTLMDPCSTSELLVFAVCCKIRNKNSKNPPWGCFFGSAPFIILGDRRKCVFFNILYSVQEKERPLFECQIRTSFWYQLVFTLVIGKKNYKKISTSMYYKQ